MKINLKDDIPVQAAYIEYLNKNWIAHSDSSYSSPVAVVRKKMEPSNDAVIIVI